MSVVTCINIKAQKDPEMLLISVCLFGLNKAMEHVCLQLLSETGVQILKPSRGVKMRIGGWWCFHLLL